MIAQANTLQTLNQGTLPGNTHQRNLKSTALDPQRTTNKPASIDSSNLIPPTITNSNWSTCLRSQLWPVHSPHTTLTQSTAPLISEPPFDKSNFICPMVLSPNVKPTYTLMPSRISWHSTPFPTHSPFALQISGKPNHVVWATNGGCTQPHARILALAIQHLPNHLPTLNQSPTTPFHKRTTWYLIWLNRATL